MEAGTLDIVAAPAARIIERPRLTKILDESNARFLLLIAPAGYGKTTLARQWLRDKPHVWYQADRSSADPAALAKGLERAFGIRDQANPTISELLSANPGLVHEAPELADALADVAKVEKGSILVVDDYQLLTAAADSELLLRYVTERLGLRLLLTTREKPSWLRSREVLYGEAIELVVDQLAMTTAEARAVVGTDSTSNAAIIGAAAGWPILLALAAEVGEIECRRASPSHLYEYLTAEILRDLPGDLERLLTQVAFAPSLGERANRAQPEVVSEAMRRGLVRLEDERLEMHPLLADFLRERWLERRDTRHVDELYGVLVEEQLWDDAFSFAEQTRRPDFLAQLLRQGAFELLSEGRVRTVERWIRASRRAGYAGELVELVQAEVAARCGRLDQAKATALATARRLVDEELRYRALLVAGRASYQSGEYTAAAEAFSLARASSEEPHAIREAIVGLAITSIQMEDETHWALLQEISEFVNDDETRLRAAGVELFAYSRFGPVDEGLRTAEQLALTATRVRDPWIRSAFLGTHAYLLALAGDYERSMQVSRTAIAEATRARLEFAIVQINLHLARLNIGLGNYAAASKILQRSLASARTAAAESQRTTITTLKLRLLVEQGLVEEALHDLRPDRTGCKAAQGELMATHAFVHACAGNASTARALADEATSITKSVEVRILAEACGAIASESSDGSTNVLTEWASKTGNLDTCVFVVRGSRLIEDGLRTVAASHTEDAVVAGHVLRLASPPRHRLRDDWDGKALSPRERDVFALLQQGLANRQIAKALFISEATVKVHLRRIYAKLGVRTRTQAVLAAGDPPPSA